jgi:hypothetical protein
VVLQGRTLLCRTPLTLLCPPVRIRQLGALWQSLGLQHVPQLQQVRLNRHHTASLPASPGKHQVRCSGNHARSVLSRMDKEEEDIPACDHCSIPWPSPQSLPPTPAIRTSAIPSLATAYPPPRTPHPSHALTRMRSYCIPPPPTHTPCPNHPLTCDCTPQPSTPTPQPSTHSHALSHLSASTTGTPLATASSSLKEHVSGFLGLTSAASTNKQGQQQQANGLGLTYMPGRPTYLVLLERCSHE